VNFILPLAARNTSSCRTELREPRRRIRWCAGARRSLARPMKSSGIPQESAQRPPPRSDRLAPLF